MNAQVQPSADLFHVSRSEFIDAFAAVEASVCARLKACGVDQPGSFGQRIEALRSVKASPKYSRAQRLAVHHQLEGLASLNAIRCDVVHSPLHVVRIYGELHACFVNPAAREESSSVARLVSSAQFDALAKELAIIAKVLAPS